MSVPLLQARQVAFAYGGRPVLECISLDLPAGSCTLIQGDNGSGKSTLLQLLQGRLQPSAGWVRLDGRSLRGQRGKVALVPQVPALRWHYPLDVIGLVALGCGGDRQRSHQALEQVDLAAQAQAAIASLSGGQRQRALIARALAQQAAVLLLDEPLAFVDATSREQLGALLSALTAAGTAVVLTAHGPLPASFQAVRQLQLQHGHLLPGG
jgi:ABC-type Mn2+/Zn2+ transport system ATPase subunit